MNGPHTLSAFANYTLQAATSESGENDGNYLKAIPRHFVTAGVNAGGEQGPAAGLVISSARRTWLDDANTRELPAWTRWDARLSWRVRSVQLFADVFGAENGIGARSAVGVSSLPGNVPVEIEAVFEIEI